MSLKEILKNEEQNQDHIYLYKGDKGWYAYEHSAFYCYSLLGIVDIGWILLSPEETDSMIIRICISDIDKLIDNPQLKLLSREECKCVISCRNFCKGFHYWREEQEMKRRYSQIRKDGVEIEKSNDSWQGILFNQNRKTKEMSVSQQTDIPVIESIYDPLSQRRDGTITPCAPVLIFGYNLLCWPKEQVEFCLCPVEEPGRMIPVTEVHKHTEKQILVTLPDLDKGDYRLVLHLSDGEGEKQVYYFPVTWQVKTMSLMDIYSERRKIHPLRS